MHRSSLLDALSPDLKARVEASLGRPISEPAPSPRAVRPCATAPPVALLRPDEIAAITASPGYVVRHGLLGPNDAAAVHAACSELRALNPLRPAQVGLGDVTTHVASARGDQLLWLPQDESALPPPLQRLLQHIEKLVYGLVKASPGLGIRNMRSTQFAIFPGNGARFVPHVDTPTPTTTKPSRRLTCLYYLNPHWVPDHGGALRLHLANNVVDIAPTLDTLVLFRSADVRHEVRPAFADRLALTIWYYGDAPAPSPSHATASMPPPLPSSDRNDDDDATIFVSIPSFRDSECAPTLRALLSTAKVPRRVHVGVCMQATPDDDVQFLHPPPPNVRVHFMDAADATGPCLARYCTQQLYNGETYYLQIDSHMRFRRHWDAYLIEQLASCPSTKPILTTYPLGYDRPDVVPADVRPTLLCALPGMDDTGLLRQCGKVLKLPTPAPLPSRFWAAGFAFSRGSVVHEVPYDPHLHFVFFGEELSMAARLFTSGYDFFAPSQAVVYHLWSRAHRPSFRDQSPHPTDENAASYVRALVRGDILDAKATEVYKGLGHVRPLSAYHALLNVSFAENEVDWTTLWGGRDPIEFALDAALTQ
ncbi:hypothetical protein SPRG_09935 [Saprolegnia parasitica CBS 223.65]|uniref:procollagen-lysine 5-dioxygenase n=1 Tax=Saprolegnia parasitica (strain CBS 223.65) TaxID=695850 RepID=A0A067C1B0_SAPPC|nr:hypothetical protein SPRG_09935 [Saprolegnia parasitica CBS 223.65]KDO24298.1 hypothetical protein SPRG_09935 [Saprolegnia parasitica CBS 223.65]|eukprot:XP_012205068.1 hypothetical protein SPRG_09935 [Saprolegnia parasitica CBS 223.65]